MQAVRATLEAAMCLENFSSQVVERHNKPEVEVARNAEVCALPDKCNKTRLVRRSIWSAGSADASGSEPKQAREGAHRGLDQLSSGVDFHQEGAVVSSAVAHAITDVIYRYSV